MKGGNEVTNGSVVTLRRSPFKIGLNNIKKENAETADYSQNTQRRAGNVATTPTTLSTPRFPPDLLFLKIANGHRVIARQRRA